MDKPPIFPVARRVSSCTYYIIVEPQKEEAVKAGKNEKQNWPEVMLNVRVFPVLMIVRFLFL